VFLTWVRAVKTSVHMADRSAQKRLKLVLNKYQYMSLPTSPPATNSQHDHSQAADNLIAA